MLFHENHAQCEMFSVRDEGVSQRLDIDERIRWPGSHPIMGDGMCFALYDRDKGPGKTFFPDMMVRSPDHRGVTGFRA